MDGRTAADDATVTGDVCVIGGGPVGLALAAALAERGRGVVVVESGGEVADSDADELNAGELIGDLGPDLRQLRARAIGGTATIWNTFLDGAPSGRFLPLDPIDFTARAARPQAWPFDFGTLEPYYRAAHGVCGLGPFDYTTATHCGAGDPPPDVRNSGLIASVYQIAPASNFVAGLAAKVRMSPRAMLIHGATATELLPSGDRRAPPGIRWATVNGRRGVVRAGVIVLAAGGIENARRLLLWQDALDAGGTAPRWLGRGFMQHPFDSSLELVSTLAPFTDSFGFFSPHRAAAGVGIMGRLGLSTALIEAEGIGNAGLYIVPLDQPQMLVESPAKSVARRVVPAQALRRALGNVVRGLAAKAWRRRGRPCRVDLYLEQLAHPDNRITLSSRTDRFGQPLPAVEWRFRPEDEVNRIRTRDVVAREFRRARLGTVRRTGIETVNRENHHHIGATRMHADPALGVVDADLRVHGTRNIYVVGSSVIPAAGFANPTLTDIALALRLADHLAPPG